MKKFYASTIFLLFTIFNLTGCGAVGAKNASQATIYLSAAILSFLLLISCLLLVKQKKTWFVLLFSSVLVVNIGYTLLATSTCLEMALWANRLSYLGSVFLPLAMLMIILDVSGTKYPKWLHGILGALSLIIFLIAASPGILPIYYKEVSFAIVDGVSTLDKVYGPLHLLYLVYLLGYFSSMIAIIIRAKIKKTLDTTAHAVTLAIAVFVNIGVWFIEQLVRIDFEILSISYIISELFLLGLHLVMNEYQKMRTIVKQVEIVQNYKIPEHNSLDTILENSFEKKIISPETVELFVSGLNQLTPTEKRIYDAYISRVTTKEIMTSLNIKESTLKYHNRNIYGKLGISSRKELLEIHNYLKTVKENLKTSK